MTTTRRWTAPETYTPKAPPKGDINSIPWQLETAQPLVFKDANVVDAAENRVLKGMTVVIEDGHFSQVLDASEAASFTPPKNARVIDMRGLYLCPGLIDCQAEWRAARGIVSGRRGLGWDLGSMPLRPGELEQVERDSAAQGFERVGSLDDRHKKEALEVLEKSGFFKIRAHTSDVHVNWSDGRPATGYVDHQLRATYTLKSMLARGFTTVRDVGGANIFQKEAIDQWLTPGPRLFQGGDILSQTGGHGDFRPREAPSHSLCCAPHIDFCTLADGVDGVTVATREMIRKGAQHIKLEGVQFTPEEIRAIVGVAKDMRATLVTAHAYTSEAVRRAVDNGVRGIEHGNLIDRDTAKLLASTGTFLTPTLMISTVKGRAPWNETLPGYMREKNAMVRDAGRRALQIAEEEGVIVCFGTDLTNGTGYLQSEEFTQRHALVPSHRVVAHATVNGAKQLGDDKLGSIRVGAYGDCLILAANPLEDCRVLDSGKDGIWGVVKEGRVVVARSEIADQVTIDVVLAVGE